jgi:hypothetical protein
MIDSYLDDRGGNRVLNNGYNYFDISDRHLHESEWDSNLNYARRLKRELNKTKLLATGL